MDFFVRFCQTKYVFFLLLQFAYFNSSRADISNQLAELSSDEIHSLTYFFSQAIQFDQLGHVLFFSTKPGCLIGRALEEGDEEFMNGWSVWNKNAHRFPHPNFLIHHEIVRLENGQQALHIYFINKHTLNTVIYKDGKGDDSESLFNQDPFFKGLLMGFGEEAAQSYCQKTKKHNKLQFIFCSYKGELQKQDGRTVYMADKNAHILPVSFLANPASQEVQTIRKQYADELEKIEAIFQRDDLLDYVLEALCS